MADRGNHDAAAASAGSSITTAHLSPGGSFLDAGPDPGLRILGLGAGLGSRLGSGDGDRVVRVRSGIKVGVRWLGSGGWGQGVRERVGENSSACKLTLGSQFAESLIHSRQTWNITNHNMINGTTVIKVHALAVSITQVSTLQTRRHGVVGLQQGPPVTQTTNQPGQPLVSAFCKSVPVQHKSSRNANPGHVHISGTSSLILINHRRCAGMQMLGMGLISQ